MDIIEKTALELAFEAFNIFMDKFNEKYTSAKDEKEAASILELHEKELIEQDLLIESAVEKDFEDSLAKSKEEEEAAAKELEDLEKSGEEVEEEEETPEFTPIELEILYLKEEELTPTDIAKRYNISNPNKNGFSTTELYKHVGGTDEKLKEIEMAEFIFKSF